MKEKFRFNPFLRFFTLFIGLIVIAYCVYIILVANPVAENISKIKMILPYLVIVLALNSVFRNFFTLNSIILDDSEIIFKKLAFGSCKMKIADIKQIKFMDKRMKLLQVTYLIGEDLKKYSFNLGFPAVLTALSKLKERNPKIEFVGDLDKMV